MILSPTCTSFGDVSKPPPEAFRRISFINIHSPVEKSDTNLDHEGKDITEDKYLCHLLRVHNRVFRTDVGDQTTVGDVVKGEKRSRRADGKELFRGEEGKTVRVGFEQPSENETQRFNWIEGGECSRNVGEQYAGVSHRMSLLAGTIPTTPSTL